MAYLLYTAGFLASLSPSLYCIYAYIRIPTHACVPNTTCALVLTYHVSLSPTQRRHLTLLSHTRTRSLDHHACDGSQLHFFIALLTRCRLLKVKARLFSLCGDRGCPPLECVLNGIAGNDQEPIKDSLTDAKPNILMSSYSFFYNSRCFLLP
jgi:hypothetical protein